MAANYLDENDRLAEAGRILRGETMMAATLAHLQALQQLVIEAYAAVQYIEQHSRAKHVEQWADWLSEADKVLPR